MMKSYLLIITLITILITEAGAENRSEQSRIPFDNNPESILIAKITLGAGAEKIDPLKVEAAVNLAALLSERFKLITSAVRDSVADYLKEINLPPKINLIADSLNASKILFINVGRMINMLRVEIVSVISSKPDSQSSGVGYSEIRYMKDENAQLLDPALLKASQRALADAVGDSNLYEREEGSLRVFPVPTLVIGGLDFSDNHAYLPKWELFAISELTSYDAVESIYERARESDDFAVYDIPTRDSIYALFNLHIIENHNPPSFYEIESLDKFKIKKFISGKFTKLKNKAAIELSLYDIIAGRLVLIKTVDGTIDKDDIVQFRSVLKELTAELLKIGSS